MEPDDPYDRNLEKSPNDISESSVHSSPKKPDFHDSASSQGDGDEDSSIKIDRPATKDFKELVDSNLFDNDEDSSDNDKKITGDKIKMSDIFGSDNEEDVEDGNAEKMQVDQQIDSTEETGGEGDQEEDETFSSNMPIKTFDDSDVITDSTNLMGEERIDDIIIEAEMPRVRPEIFFGATATVTNNKANSSGGIASNNNEMYFVKLPNFLSVEPKPFNAPTFEDEVSGFLAAPEDEDNKTRLKLRVENTVRWRYANQNENDVNDFRTNSDKESNAKIIKWSDGSMSLQLGSEFFDIYKTQITNDFNHLFVRQGTGLQGQAIFKEKLSFRPHSTNSITHRKMTLSLADRCSKTRKSIKVLAGTDKTIKGDPELIKAELYKREEEKLRASFKMAYQSKKVSCHNKIGMKKHHKGADDLSNETDDYFETGGADDVSITAIKKSVMNNFHSSGFNNSRGYNSYETPNSSVKESRPKIYSSDSDDDYGNSVEKKVSQKKSAKIINESDED
ncbi:unnamed protein product [Gordionus sp. m RMFG-2023]